jgi:hypothetical protein
MVNQFLLRAHSSVCTILQIFAKVSEAAADRRDGARNGRVVLNGIGLVAASAAATMIVLQLLLLLLLP